jgi:hypothetical protein
VLAAAACITRKETSAIGRALPFCLALSPANRHPDWTELTDCEPVTGIAPQSEQASKASKSCCFHKPAHARSLRRLRAQPSLFTPISWTAFLDHRHSVLSVCFAYQTCIILSSASCWSGPSLASDDLGTSNDKNNDNNNNNNNTTTTRAGTRILCA